MTAPPSPRGWRRSSRAGLVALCLAAVLGCSQAVRRPTPGIELGGLPGLPRVRLEAVVQPPAGTQGRAGRFLRRVAGLDGDELLFARPYGVAWDGDDLVVADPGAGRLVRVDPRGRVRLSSAADLESPIGVAVCAAGVVVSDSRRGRVVLLDRGLRQISVLAEGLARPTGVACSDERIFVAETGAHRLVVLSPPAAASALGRRGDGEGEFNFPTAIAAGDGSLWVGDTLNFRLQRLDAESGTFQDLFGRLGDAPGELPRLKGIAVDPAGRLWVSDAYLDQVAVFSAAGTFLMAIGGPGGDPGEFSFPAGVAVHPDGRVAVADSLNRRVQVIRLVELLAAEADAGPGR